jgi:hypothetical protein
MSTSAKWDHQTLALDVNGTSLELDTLVHHGQKPPRRRPDTSRPSATASSTRSPLPSSSNCEVSATPFSPDSTPKARNQRRRDSPVSRPWPLGDRHVSQKGRPQLRERPSFFG